MPGVAEDGEGEGGQKRTGEKAEQDLEYFQALSLLGAGSSCGSGQFNGCEPLAAAGSN